MTVVVGDDGSRLLLGRAPSGSADRGSPREPLGPDEGDGRRRRRKRIGFFIAQTFPTVRSGARHLRQQALPEHGAEIRIQWPRSFWPGGGQTDRFVEFPRRIRRFPEPIDWGQPADARGDVSACLGSRSGRGDGAAHPVMGLKYKASRPRLRPGWTVGTAGTDGTEAMTIQTDLSRRHWPPTPKNLLIVDDGKAFLQKRLARAMELHAASRWRQPRRSRRASPRSMPEPALRRGRHAARRRQRARRGRAHLRKQRQAHTVVLTGYGNIATAVTAVKLGILRLSPQTADADGRCAPLLRFRRRA